MRSRFDRRRPACATSRPRPQIRRSQTAKRDAVLCGRVGHSGKVNGPDSLFHQCGHLANPISKPQLTELETAARALGRRIHVLNASTESDFETAFAAVDQQRIDALLAAADPFFDDRRTQLVALAARHKLPTSYVRREF